MASTEAPKPGWRSQRGWVVTESSSQISGGTANPPCLAPIFQTATPQMYKRFASMRASPGWLVAVGSSFGGGVALRLASDSPLELASFGLMGTALRGSAEALQMALQLLDELGVDMFFQQIAEHFSLAPNASAQQIELVAQMAVGRPLPVVRAVLEAGFTEDFRSLAEQATAPALVAVGAKDSTCPRPAASAVAETLGAPLEVIANAGHLPMVERPDAVAAFVRSVVTLAT